MTGAEIMNLLVERWPAVFSLKHPKPLKIGIYDDLIAAKTTLSPEEIKAGIACYCGRPAYLKCLRAGALRVDLDGNVAGEVTPDQGEHAKDKFWKLRERRKAKASAPLPQSQPPPPPLRPPAPLRLKTGKTVEVTIRRRRAKLRPLA